MVKPRSQLAAACLCAGLVVAAPAVVLAQPKPASSKPAADPGKEKAAAYLKTGTRAANAGQWDDAYAELSIAWKLHQSWEIAAALGKAALRTQHHAEALARLSYYLREAPPARVSAKQRAEAEAWILEAKAKTGTVTITAAPGAEIAIDGEVVGAAPLAEPVHVDAGKRTIEARGPGGNETKDLEIAAGAAADVAFTVPKTPEVTTTAPIVKAEGGLAGAPRTAVLIGGAALAVGGFVAGGVSLGIAAGKGAQKAEAAGSPDGRAATQELALAEADARNAALWSFVGGGLAAAGTAAFFFATRPGSKAPVKGAAFVTPAGPGVWIQGEF